MSQRLVIFFRLVNISKPLLENASICIFPPIPLGLFCGRLAVLSATQGLVLVTGQAKVMQFHRNAAELECFDLQSSHR